LFWFFLLLVEDGGLDVNTGEVQPNTSPGDNGFA